MPVHHPRPAAGELTYQVYSRALHPELFDVRETCVLKGPSYELVLRLCESGHVVELRRQDTTVVEISTNDGCDIPQRGRCLSTRLTGGRDLECQPLPDMIFQASIQIETVDSEVFERLTGEFQEDMQHATVAHVFSSRNRMRPEGISLLFAECASRTIGIHAFHTFPDDFAIVRTQSLYQFGTVPE